MGSGAGGQESTQEEGLQFGLGVTGNGFSRDMGKPPVRKWGRQLAVLGMKVPGGLLQDVGDGSMGLGQPGLLPSMLNFDVCRVFCMVVVGSVASSVVGFIVKRSFFLIVVLG